MRKACSSVTHGAKEQHWKGQPPWCGGESMVLGGCLRSEGKLEAKLTLQTMSPFCPLH